MSIIAKQLIEKETTKHKNEKTAKQLPTESFMSDFAMMISQAIYSNSYINIIIVKITR